MKQCIALAGLACLLASGCAGSGMMNHRSSGMSARVATSQRAARPKISRNLQREGVDRASYEYAASCACGDACSQGCDACNSRCNQMVEGVASGFCGGCGGCNGMCPNGGGYPEYPAFNQGPPTGQVAYPYYTVRGPRDFLRDKPPSIGPY